MAQRAPFPNDPDTFDGDDRISYSKQDARFILEDEEGEEWEWLTGPGKWSKTVRISRNPVHHIDRLWPASFTATPSTATQTQATGELEAHGLQTSNVMPRAIDG